MSGICERPPGESGFNFFSAIDQTFFCINVSQSEIQRLHYALRKQKSLWHLFKFEDEHLGTYTNINNHYRNSITKFNKT